MRLQAPAVGALVAAVAWPALMVWRGYPWRLALVTAVALGALGYVTVRTVARLRELGEPPRGDGASRLHRASRSLVGRVGGDRTPRKAGDGGQQQQVDPAAEDPTDPQ